MLKKLEKPGRKAPGRSTVDRWLRDPVAGKPIPGSSLGIAASAGPVEAPEDAPERAPVDTSEMAPAELSAWLAVEIRRAQADAATCRAQADQPGAGRAMRLAAQLAALLARVHARTDDDGDSVRVSASDVQAAAQRALKDLTNIAKAVAEERATWPKCEHCGQPAGAFAAADVSPVRALFESVAR